MMKYFKSALLLAKKMGAVENELWIVLLAKKLKLRKIIGYDFSDGRQSPSDALDNWPVV